MKSGFFIVLALTVFSYVSQAQTTKTGVVVIGNGNSAVGAGIQSAVSGVKTTLILSTQDFQLSALGNSQASGIEGEILKRIKGNAGQVLVDYSTVGTVVRSWTDTLKNLTVIRGAGLLKIKRSGSGWNIELTGGKIIKAGVLVNADRTGTVSNALQLPKVPLQWKPFNYDDYLYRASVASGYILSGGSASFLLMDKLMLPGQENLIVLNPDQESFVAGQAAGATAAYAVFFKTKISLANLKLIQGELLNYKLSLAPFADVNNADSNWKDIQVIGLSGFLKAEISNGTAYFRPDQEVLSVEIKEPVKSYYYKAQIWFDDHKEEKMTINNTLKMISYVAGLSLENTIKEVKKNWKKGYNFSTEYDSDRVITRREFAVLSRYLKPFNVNLDKTGKVVR
ncbi:hypothetical protein [Pedobacter frigoris]|uniref:FAD-dependent oxidoreductase n=1 Tax=Pedobacter frigoris TaxID=2571272 RepID=A0A4U1CEK1_9SPHI|nr:hypothetical protein [Pedobacter frigoris]TKC04971.1 hypothetical protein FA047_14470 [Pedobacter frigoris]